MILGYNIFKTAIPLSIKLLRNKTNIVCIAMWSLVTCGILIIPSKVH